MKQLYLFDVDGTLTPPRQQIDEEFRLFMLEFCTNKSCAIVTGSDQEKTIEQIGEELYNKFEVQFQCSGNQVYIGSTNLEYEEKWKLPEDAEMWLQRALDNSKFVARTGKHIEHRPGMVNFSVVGRNATYGERQLYVKFDEETNERNEIARKFNTTYNPRGIQATVGGETGLDVTPIGKDKGQVTEWYCDTEFTFFGDDCQEGGNDFALASKIIEKRLGYVYNVDNDKQTYEILKEIK